MNVLFSSNGNEMYFMWNYIFFNYTLDKKYVQMKVSLSVVGT